MQVAVELVQRDHVHMPLPRMRNDSSDLVLGVAPLGIQQIIAAQLNARFVVHVILVGFPARQKVYLALDFSHCRQRPVAKVHHETPVGQGGPVVDGDLGKEPAGSIALHKLGQRLNAIKKAVADATSVNPDLVRFPGILTSMIIRAGKGVHGARAEKRNHRSGCALGLNRNRRPHDAGQGRGEFIGRDSVFNARSGTEADGQRPQSEPSRSVFDLLGAGQQRPVSGGQQGHRKCKNDPPHLVTHGMMLPSEGRYRNGCPHCQGAFIQHAGQIRRRVSGAGPWTN